MTDEPDLPRLAARTPEQQARWVTRREAADLLGYSPSSLATVMGRHPRRWPGPVALLRTGRAWAMLWDADALRAAAPPATGGAATVRPSSRATVSDPGGLLTCLECGRQLRALGRHLAVAHGMTRAEYLQAHRLPATAAVLSDGARAEQSARMVKVLEQDPHALDHLAPWQAPERLDRMRVGAVASVRRTQGYDLTRERRRPGRAHGARRMAAARADRLEAAARAAGYASVRDAVEATMDMPAAAAAAAVGVSVSTIRRRRQQAPQPRPRRWSDQEMIRSLRRVAHAVQGSLPRSVYDARRGCGPAPATVAARFGGWAAALEAAGLVPAEQRTWTDEDLLDALRRASRQGTLTPAGYEARREPRDPRSTVTIEQRFGTWHRAVLAAGLHPSTRHWTHLSDDDLLQPLRRMLAAHSQAPDAVTSGYYNTHRGPDAPSYHLLRTRFGSWPTARDAALGIATDWPTCAANGCDRPAWGHRTELCARHTNAARRGADPAHPARRGRPPTLDAHRADQILAAYHTGKHTVAELAADYGVSKDTIYRTLKRARAHPHRTRHPHPESV